MRSRVEIIAQVQKVSREMGSTVSWEESKLIHSSILLQQTPQQSLIIDNVNFTRDNPPVYFPVTDPNDPSFILSSARNDRRVATLAPPAVDQFGSMDVSRHQSR